ncbi:MAG: hypothetical protein H7333_07160 [Bdellovibrionales bacterium]|nr:hypothetical protein [Oligoflexia bacterium]
MKTKRLSFVLTALALLSPISIPFTFAQNDYRGGNNGAPTGADSTGVTNGGGNDARDAATTGGTGSTTGRSTGNMVQDTNQYAQEQRVGNERSGTSPIWIALLVVAAIALIGYAMKSSRERARHPG